jgi:hypothetical protein
MAFMGQRNTNLQSSTYDGLASGVASAFQIVYSTRNAGWSTFVSTNGSSGQIAGFSDQTITYMIQTSPFPENVSATYSALVSGSYDSYWQQIGTQLKNKADQGFNIILSIAWEMNGTYFYWGGGSGTGKYSSPAQYIAGYQRIVNQLRVTYPGIQTAWIINAHATPAGLEQQMHGTCIRVMLMSPMSVPMTTITILLLLQNLRLMQGQMPTVECTGWLTLLPSTGSRLLSGNGA